VSEPLPVARRDSWASSLVVVKRDRWAGYWSSLGPNMLPFADAASTELPLSRLLRLSLFQVTVGMAATLLIGTLNRVMIVELQVSAWIVGLMVSLPLLFAPARMLIGYKSDVHTSVLGWRRVPYIAMGTMLQFGGLAIMPMALMLLSGDGDAPPGVAEGAAALAFLLVGAGMHTVQTVGLALATEQSPPERRPQVVALLMMMLLGGMVLSAIVFGILLAKFSPVRLIQVIQGAAVVTMLLNTAALWQQEGRDRTRHGPEVKRPTFAEAWAAFSATGQAKRRLFALGLGTAAFSMQDVLLEPYGGKVLGLSVGATTALTAVLAMGGLTGLWLAARWLGRGADPYRVAATGAIAGMGAFSALILSAPLGSSLLFATGVAMIGFGGGVFAHATLTAAMNACRDDQTGFALGMWGAVQATAAGLAIAGGGLIADIAGHLGARGALGDAMTGPAVGYAVVYHIEIFMLIAALIAIGPLVRGHRPRVDATHAVRSEPQAAELVAVSTSRA
jgi:MFS transporter, BCD family, chlorophyll transporter